MGHAADGFSGILLLSEEHEFAFMASCGELRMTLQETDTDPVHTVTSMYAVTRAEFFAEA